MKFLSMRDRGRGMCDGSAVDSRMPDLGHAPTFGTAGLAPVVGPETAHGRHCSQVTWGCWAGNIVWGFRSDTGLLRNVLKNNQGTAAGLRN